MRYIQNPQQQRGATFLGMLVIVAILGLALYSVIRLWPLYYEYYTVASTMESVAKRNQGADIPQLRTALSTAWVTQYISSIDPKDIEIKKTDSGVEMHLQYEGRASFISNIYWVVDFDKTVTVSNGAGGG